MGLRTSMWMVACVATNACAQKQLTPSLGLLEYLAELESIEGKLQGPADMVDSDILLSAESALEAELIPGGKINSDQSKPKVTVKSSEQKKQEDEQ